MSAKPRFPRAAALEVAGEICQALKPACARLVVAGSLRRRKPDVGDVEIVYVSLSREERDGLFDVASVCAVNTALDLLIHRGVIVRRETIRGAASWGEKNKYARHVASGIPIDFFATTEAAWFNYLVCRTGGAVNNTTIAGAAQRKGWRWNPYGPGFTDAHGAIVPVTCEADAFSLVGLTPLEPWQRA